VLVLLTLIEDLVQIHGVVAQHRLAALVGGWRNLALHRVRLAHEVALLEERLPLGDHAALVVLQRDILLRDLRQVGH